MASVKCLVSEEAEAYQSHWILMASGRERVRGSLLTTVQGQRIDEWKRRFIFLDYCCCYSISCALATAAQCLSFLRGPFTTFLPLPHLQYKHIGHSAVPAVRDSSWEWGKHSTVLASPVLQISCLMQDWAAPAITKTHRGVILASP